MRWELRWLRSIAQSSGTLPLACDRKCLGLFKVLHSFKVLTNE